MQRHKRDKGELPMMFAFCHNYVVSMPLNLEEVLTPDSAHCRMDVIWREWEKFRGFIERAQARRRGRNWRLANIYNPHTEIGRAWLQLEFRRVEAADELAVKPAPASS